MKEKMMFYVQCILVSLGCGILALILMIGGFWAFGTWAEKHERVKYERMYETVETMDNVTTWENGKNIKSWK